jgi:hypothetical protein
MDKIVTKCDSTTLCTFPWVLQHDHKKDCVYLSDQLQLVQYKMRVVWRRALLHIHM